MKEKKVYVYDFFDSDLECIESKFMSYDEAVEYAIKTEMLFQKSIVHDIQTKEGKLQQMSMPYTKCPKCARIFDEYANYCRVCGSKLKGIEKCTKQK